MDLTFTSRLTWRLLTLVSLSKSWYRELSACLFSINIEVYCILLKLVFDLFKDDKFLLLTNSTDWSFIKNLLNLPELISLDKERSLLFYSNSFNCGWNSNYGGLILIISCPHFIQHIKIKLLSGFCILFYRVNLKYFGDTKSMCLMIA